MKSGLAAVDVLALQRQAGNHATAQLLGEIPVQREATKEKPYAATNKPPTFEYWVNSMWGEVADEKVRDSALAQLRGTEATPRAGSGLDVKTKSSVLRLLYGNAYQEKVWYPAAKLIEEQSLKHQLQSPVDKSAMSTRTETIAAGFHGTWRDPDTVLKAHKGTIPTVERHGKAAGDTAAIQEFLKTELGIEEWHPFWFGGDVASRPFLFRNVQADNELDTTISVAKDAKDSLDFPMIESMNKKDIERYDEHGLPITTTYVYLVGVTQGFGTSKHLQGATVFGEGEIATQKLDPNDHLGFVRYRRRHGGGSRNDGYQYSRIFSDVLPGARQRRITGQAQAILDGMPRDGFNRCSSSAFDFEAIYTRLYDDGKRQGQSAKTNKFAKHKLAWTPEQWKAQLANSNDLQKAPTAEAKAIREQKYLDGIRSVLGRIPAA